MGRVVMSFMCDDHVCTGFAILAASCVTMVASALLSAALV